MKNKTLQSFFVGIATVAAASGSYALIAPNAFEELRASNEQQLIFNKVNEISQQTPFTLIQPTVPQPLSHQVKPGENLATIFDLHHLSATDLHKITHANAAGKQLADVEPGQNLVIKRDATGKLEQLTFTKNPVETLIATRHDNAFDVQLLSKHIDTQITHASGEIHDSLFEDGLKAGLSEKALLKMVDIFAWDVDFALNLQDGDRFTVVFETLLVEGKAFDTGEILSAEFVNKGKVYTAIRFVDNQGNTGYYTPDGTGLRKAFLQTPLDFARISSHFSLGRKHPILNTIRAHKGVDYAASSGTPIKTTADGKISFLGNRSGYGKVVEISHGSQYSTLYAHLSRFKTGQKTGGLVKQGDIIGYVGQTGLATGPHLHYEFRIDGRHVDPVTAKFPRSMPMDKALFAQFKAQTEPLVSELNQAKTESLSVAKN